MLRPIILLVTTLFITTLYAAEVVVSVKSMETLEAIPGLKVSAYGAENRLLAKGVENSVDTTYSITGIEVFPCRIDVNTGASIFSEDLHKYQDTVTLLLPLKYAYKELRPIEVNAISAYIKDDRTVFRPSRREKNGAMGGAGLLRNMMLAQISVDPITDAIRMASGDVAECFIDYMPASQEEIRALRPQDVNRVEVFDYPVDPRFMGALHVVNFVMRHYDSGGYTKLDASERFIGNAGNYSVSSKFMSKRFMLDAVAGVNFMASTHSGSDSRTVYGFGSDKIVNTVKLLDSKLRNNSEFITIRLNYSGARYLLSNKIGVNIWNVPVNENRSRSLFSPEIYSGDVAHSSYSRSGVTPYWIGNYQWNLPNGFFLTVVPEAAYGYSTSHDIFKSETNNVVNNIAEKSWQVKGRVALQKSINRHAFTITFNGDYRLNDLKYTGTTVSSVTESYGGFVARVGANLRFSDFWLQGSGGVVIGRQSIESVSQTNVHPKFFVAAGYRFNDRNQLSVSSELSHWTVPLSMMGSNMIIINDIDAIAGNPHLKPSRFNAVSANYTALLRNWLSLEFFGNYTRHNSPATSCYIPSSTTGHPFLIIRSTINNGNFYQWRYGGSVSVKCLDNSLSFKLSGCVMSSTRSGLISFSRTDWEMEALATYFFKGFTVQGGYTKASTASNTGGWQKTPDFYFLAAGWGHGDLSIGLRIANIFNSDYISRQKYIAQPAYNMCSTDFSDSYHRWVALTFSYSISYAKKINKTAQLNSDYSIESGILK